jgi:DNA-directed RNA polymerase alpha subunit
MFAKLVYDTKEECLVDRDKLLDWLRGDNNETNNLVLEGDKELRKLFEEPLSEQALDNIEEYLIGWENTYGLSVRTVNCFLSKDARYPKPNNFREVLMMTDAELLRWPNFGRKSLCGFKEWLKTMNLKTTMTQEEIENFLINHIKVEGNCFKDRHLKSTE